MLVDMAGSENIEQAGQNGFEAKMQTAKINQGNIALKRVVESIANGDSHVPFRDSKLTMLLQDSFEDDKSKILMILCASPDPKELHKTIATLEYGAKAKCIVRAQHTPIKEKGGEDSSSAVILGSRIEAMDQFIYKLQMENKLKEKERIEAQKKLNKKEEEISSLRAKLTLVEGRGKEEISEEEINSKVNEQNLMLKRELERKIHECQKMADEFVEMERRKMEERMLQQQQEVEMLRHRLEEIESELHLLRAGGASADMDGSSFMKRLLEVCAEDSDMVKSMDLDRSIDMETSVVHKSDVRGNAIISCLPNTSNFNENITNFPNKAFLSTVYEEDEEENEEQGKEDPIDEEVQKEVIEEKKMIVTPECSIQYPEQIDDSSRQKRIQNIFTLCGNYRELSQHNRTPMPTQKRLETIDSLSTLSRAEGEHFAKLMPGDLSQLQNSISKILSASNEHGNKQNLDENKLGKVTGFDEIAKVLKENHNPVDESTGGDIVEVHVKWEVSKENPGKFIATLKFLKDSTLADLRKLIEIHFGGEQQEFVFLLLGDPSGAPIPREKEATTRTSDLPVCNNGHLACLRPLKPIQRTIHLPFSPLENKLAATPNSPHVTQQGDCYSPKIAQHLSSTPFITVRRY